MRKPEENIWLVGFAFFAIYFIWGTTYLAALFGLDGMAPYVICTLRYLTAGVLLLGWSFFYGRKFAITKNDLLTCAISGTLMLVGGTGLVVYAEQYVTSGEAAVIVATEPLFFLLIDHQRWKTYFSSPLILCGMALGFGGVLLFSRGYDQSVPNAAPGNTHLYGILILLAAAVFWVLGALYARNRLPADGSNTRNSALQLLSAGVVSAALASITGDWQRFDPAHTSAKAWGGLLFLILMGSLVAYVAYTWLITIRPPALISTHTYVNPVVALGMGWLFASEHISTTQMIALVLILGGVLMANYPGHGKKSA